MQQNEKFIGEARLLEDAKMKLLLKLKDGSVTNEKIAAKSITADKLADNIITDIIQPAVAAAVEAMKRELGHVAMIRT